MRALGNEGKTQREFGASERVLINECMPVAVPPHFVGVGVVELVGVLDRQPARSTVDSVHAPQHSVLFVATKEYHAHHRRAFMPTS